MPLDIASVKFIVMHMAKSQTPEYKIWAGIKQRCFNPKNPVFRHYGGRGVTMCERWRSSFETFLADVGPRPSPKHSIDRIDNDRGYEPGNCRWVVQRQQAANTRPAKAYRTALTEKFPEVYGPIEFLVKDDQLVRELAECIAKAGSLRTVAEAIGVSPTYVSMVMTGKSPPSEKIGEFLGYSLAPERWSKRSDFAAPAVKRKRT